MFIVFFEVQVAEPFQQDFEKSILNLRSRNRKSKIENRKFLMSRIDQLLSEMSPEEMAGQLNLAPNEAEVDPARIRSGEVGSVICSTSAYAGSDKQHRVRAGKINELQREAVENSRLKIPLLVGRDVIHGHRTVAPIPLGQAASWSPEDVRKSARVASDEAYVDGIRWIYTPMLDIARDPRWGRVAEGYGEDPYLGSTLARACIEGLQQGEPNGSLKMAACAKHFAGYGAAEGGRDYNTAEISPYTMRNIYLPPFKAAVDAGVASIMTCFNDLGGVPVTADPHLVRHVLREEWGFEGVTVSDWGAVLELVEHGVAGSACDAAARALRAGIDIDMAAECYMALPHLVKKGVVQEGWMRDAVRRVLALKERLGLFDNPYTDESLSDKAQLTDASKETVLSLVRKTLVLLKNSNRVLPIAKDAKRIGLFGPLVEEREALLGTWCLDGEASDVVTLQEACEQEFGKARIICHTLADQSISFARYCDVAVVALGEFAQRTGETNSVADIGLPPGQVEFVQGLKRMGVPIVAVVFAGRPLAITWLEEIVDAILWAWHPGILGSVAVAEVLSGRLNPSGKLPITFPRSTGQVPIYYNHRPTGRPLDPYARGDSRYVDERDSPLYPFGFGLSYSSFEYGSLRVDRRGERFEVRCSIKNDSAVDGEEIAQLYIRDHVASAARPVKELKRYARVALKAGEQREVQFELGEQDLGFWGPDEQWRVEKGGFDVWVGPDSRRGVQAEFEL